MIVMKFGGTSIATTDAVERVVGIIQRFLSQKPVVVNSAMGKTTRNLLDIAHLSEAGKTEEAKEKLQEIIDFHHDLASSVLTNFEQANVYKTLNIYFSELEKLLHGMSVLQDLTLRSLDKFLSYGERMSTAIISEVLNQKKINSVLTDARSFIITNDHFGQAKVIRKESDEKIQTTLLPIIDKGNVPVVQGYIGATQKGITTTLGFEGSDLTATLVGAALEADEIQIWKDVPGIMTADPHLISNTYTIRQISFEEAGELTFFGAKVLHPSSLAPALEKHIRVHVYNSTAPDNEGTEITHTPTSCKNLIKSIAYKRNLNLVRIQSNRKLTPYDFMKSVFDVLDRARLTPYLSSTAETQIALVFSETNLERLVEDLKPYGNVRMESNKGTITLVGENVRHTQTFPQLVLQALSTTPIDLISFGASSIQLTLVVDENLVTSTVELLHNAFFKTIDPQIFQ